LSPLEVPPVPFPVPVEGAEVPPLPPESVVPPEVPVAGVAVAVAAGAVLEPDWLLGAVVPDSAVADGVGVAVPLAVGVAVPRPCELCGIGTETGWPGTSL
jgi:hypothetical protein